MHICSKETKTKLESRNVQCVFGVGAERDCEVEVAFLLH